ncbi:hypothetical protein [Fodinibius sp. SL11]|uniref:hypothetical protein n=1 Tax=Fodinibius sp. SL11 TaxID=3425690 RepID=UPI003F881D2F
MGYYTVDHSGSTRVGEDKDIVTYQKDEPIEDVKKGDLDHVNGAEYHKGKPSDEKDEDDGEKK